jgi:hypothetical protein
MVEKVNGTTMAVGKTCLMRPVSTGGRHMCEGKAFTRDSSRCKIIGPKDNEPDEPGRTVPSEYILLTKNFKNKHRGEIRCNVTKIAGFENRSAAYI